MKPKIERIELSPSGQWVYRCACPRAYGLGETKAMAFDNWRSVIDRLDLQDRCVAWEIALGAAILKNIAHGMPTATGCA